MAEEGVMKDVFTVVIEMGLEAECRDTGLHSVQACLPAQHGERYVEHADRGIGVRAKEGAIFVDKVAALGICRRNDKREWSVGRTGCGIDLTRLIVVSHIEVHQNPVISKRCGDGAQSSDLGKMGVTTSIIAFHTIDLDEDVWQRGIRTHVREIYAGFRRIVGASAE